MSEAEAAIQAANITLWGAIVVGSLAMIGTIVSTVVAPSMRARAEAKERLKNARVEAHREIIPKLFVLGMRKRFAESGSTEEAALLLAELSRFDLWLTPDEWIVGRLARNGLLTVTNHESPDDEIQKETEAFNAAMILLPLWARGELTADEVADRYKRATGITLRNTTPGMPTTS